MKLNLNTIRLEGAIGGSDPLKERLYLLCESIGDAQLWLNEPLESEELQKVRSGISEMKQEFRSLIGVDSKWEPESGNWRMGCY